jgi:NADPH-dependent curcumin reductase CurA
MSDLVNRAFRLRQRPVGRVTTDDLELVEEAVPAIGEGEALVRTRYLSLDPTNRIWMSDIRSYLPPVPLGDVMRGAGVGEVVESRRADLKPGALVSGMTGWQDYAVAADSSFTVLPDPLPAPLPAFLGVLGHTGITAWLGLKNIGRIREGETVFVSAAAGAVGSVAGQLARRWGAGRVVGCAGGPEKCRHVVEDLGFDDCVDYKRPGWRERIDEATPDGIDVDFENVGGEIMDHVFGRLNFRARVALCGMISQYNSDGSWGGQTGIGEMIMQRVTMTGFVVLDHGDQFAEAIGDLAQLWAAGAIRADEMIVDGLENARETLNELFDGGNTGKLLIKVADPG